MAVARPAEALLAAQVLGDQELDGLVEGVGIKRKRSECELLGTGVGSVDGALGGGVEGGRVVGISAAAGEGGSEICRALLANSLLKYANSTAAVIDTTGNFDVLGLYTLLVEKQRKNPATFAALRASISASESEVTIEDVAAKVLDRVKIMRVFDFVGIREAVGEVRDGLEGRRGVAANRGPEETAPVKEEKEVPSKQAPQKSKRTVVADSEDEDDDDEEEEDMLFDAELSVSAAQSTEHIPTPPPPQHPEPEQTQTNDHVQTRQNTEAQNPSTTVKFILIDNLAQVLNPLMKKDYISAHVLATTFLATLAYLTKTHALHTILLNPTTTPRPLSPSRTPHPHHPPPPPPSIFASNIALPGLAGVLPRYVDVGVLVSRMPRRRMDAKVFFSEAGGARSRGGKRGVEMVGVVEVVADRWAGRVGAWGTFREEKEGVLGDVA